MLGISGDERAHAALEVAVGDKLRMLAGDEQDIAKTFRREMPRLLHHGLDVERDAQDGVVAREAAVGAVVDALVGEIERREEADRLAEMPPRERGRLARQRLELRVGPRLQQRGEASERGRDGRVDGERRVMKSGAGICGRAPACK